MKLLNQSDIVQRVTNLFQSLFSFSPVKSKVLTQILLQPNSTGREISKTLKIPDSKVYPALRQLYEEHIISMTKTRPASYYIHELDDILNHKERIINERIQKIREESEELSNLVKEIWEPISSETELSYIVKSDHLNREIYSIMRNSTQKLELLFSKQAITQLKFNKIVQIILILLRKGIVIHLALPKEILILFRTSQVILSESPVTINRDQLTKLLQYEGEALFFKESRLTSSSYIIRDDKTVIHILHHIIESFAVISTDLDFVTLIRGCWDDESCCTSIENSKSSQSSSKTQKVIQCGD